MDNDIPLSVDINKENEILDLLNEKKNVQRIINRIEKLITLFFAFLIIIELSVVLEDIFGKLHMSYMFAILIFVLNFIFKLLTCKIKSFKDVLICFLYSLLALIAWPYLSVNLSRLLKKKYIYKLNEIETKINELNGL